MTRRKSENVDFAIIGAGFAGLGMGIRLKMAGRHNFVILERADELGGTWRDNTYPGCACDVPSLVYSFSFDQNPDWSRLYPSQPEILAYLKACAKKFNIRQHIRFNCESHYGRFNEENGRWLLRTKDGSEFDARYVISATGPLNRPHIPKLPGLETFAGESFHSSQWNHAYDLSGKRVAVIGTGASAIQFVPQIAPIVDQLYVFQRTPPWIVPRGDVSVSTQKRRWFRRLPWLQKLLRCRRYWQLETAVLGFLGNRRIQKFATDIALEHIQTSISDPELRQAVTPNYTFGCKRALVSDDYYPTLERENVELVTAKIEAIQPNAIVTNDGVERPIDALIFGTGFVASEILLDMKVYGRNGRELISHWMEDGPEAYLGISTSGFPNLFFLLGPNTGLGHNSVLLMIESQYNYIMDYVRQLEKSGDHFWDVDPQAEQIYNHEIQEKLKSTVWQSGGCTSWYQTPKGKNTTLWPGSTVGYRRKTRQIDRGAYQKGTKK